MAKSPTMETWFPYRVWALLLSLRVWLRSPASIAWRLSQFEAQTRFMMRTAWAQILRGIRPVISLFVFFSILPWSLWGCVRHAELPYHVRRATVCMTPPPVPPDANIFAYHRASGTWEFEDEDDIEGFADFVQHADIIFFRDYSAPPESVAAFPIPYNMLSCDNPNAVIPRAVYYGQRLPNSNELPLAQAGRVHLQTTFEDASALSRGFLGAVAATPKRGPEIIHVCTHPPDVHPDALEWLFTTEKVGTSYTYDAELYARLRANAKRVYVFDPNAPGESVLRFAAPYDRLRCPGKPLIGDTSDEANKKAAFDALVASVMAKASVSEFGGTGGSDKRTWTSTPEGQGASLTFFESVVRQMVIAGAFQSGDVSGDLKDPNGSRYGIPNGKNVGGPDSLALQMAAGTFLMLKTPLRTTAAFGRKIAQAARQKGVLIIANVKLFPLAIAKQLIKDYGQDMAPSLHQLKTIMPYSRASMFTKGWDKLYEAHKILEKSMWKEAFDRADFEDLPAIILKKEEHDAITAKLKKAEEKWIDDQLKMKKDTELTPKELWKIYEDVYKDNPNWLQAIKQYFE